MPQIAHIFKGTGSKLAPGREAVTSFLELICDKDKSDVPCMSPAA